MSNSLLGERQDMSSSEDIPVLETTQLYYVVKFGQVNFASELVEEQYGHGCVRSVTVFDNSMPLSWNLFAGYDTIAVIQGR